jgi:hypothetical protein
MGFVFSSDAGKTGFFSGMGSATLGVAVKSGCTGFGELATGAVSFGLGGCLLVSPTQTHSLVSLFCSQFHDASLAKLVEAVIDGKKTRNKRRSIDDS